MSTDFGPLRYIRRFWAAPSYLAALDESEPGLIDRLSQCVEKLRRNPQQPSLNCESLGADGLWSCRITQSDRLIFARVAADEVALLYFTADHDGAYRWADRHASQVATYLERRRELRPLGAVPSPVKSVLRDERELVPLPSDDVLQRMLRNGMQGYLSFLDEHQNYLSQLSFEDLNGPTLVKGGAGTGKTALAVARLRFLAQKPEMGYGPVLYLCYNRMLRDSVVQMLKWQYGGQYPWEQIDVESVHQWCGRYLDGIQATTKPWEIERRFEQACRSRDPRVIALVKDEVNNYLRPLGLTELDSYLSLERRGATKRLEANQRRAVWAAYDRFLQDQSIVEFEDFPALALEKLAGDQDFVPYRAAVIDEGQDFSPVMIRLARALVGGDDRRLFVLADVAQSVYPSGFSWSQRELGARGGQIRFLRSSYRNTAEIQALARSLYRTDAEFGAEMRETNDAERHGLVPRLSVHFTEEQEREGLASSILTTLDSQETAPEQIAVLAYSQAVLRAVANRLEASGVSVRLVDRNQRTIRLDEPTVKLMTIHQSKGLDFPYVFLTGIYSAEVPFLSNERRRALLYVGITRASSALQITTVFSKCDQLLRDLDSSLLIVDGEAELNWEATSEGLTSDVITSR